MWCSDQFKTWLAEPITKNDTMRGGTVLTQKYQTVLDSSTTKTTVQLSMEFKVIGQRYYKVDLQYKLNKQTNTHTAMNPVSVIHYQIYNFVITSEMLTQWINHSVSNKSKQSQQINTDT